jgi:hypothetical protein
MTLRRVAAVMTVMMLGAASPAPAQDPGGFSVEVLVDDRPVPVHAWRGARYVEALKGQEYAIRLRNPLGVRVAVALSVDGLNSIDARRTTAADARKWVLGPYQTVTIRGWQTSLDHARRFYFTSEEDSYANRLGQAGHLGVISAVFFRERARPVTPITEAEPAGRPSSAERGEGAGRAQRGAPTAAAPAVGASAQASADDYAATGIGRRTGHRVQQVSIDLEPTPTASVTLRYEYRPQLVRLGVLPPTADPLARRERATGFEPGFCPEPPRRVRR